MPRARNPARDTAWEMWLASGKTAKLRDIAKELGVPEKTVSAWKSKDKWDKKNERSTPNGNGSTPNGNGSTAKRKRGGQPGNKNAKGGPPGNRHGVVTGAFETIFFDSLDDDERELLAAMHDDKRQTLQHQIDTLLIRQRRMLKRIVELRNGEAMVTRNQSVTSEPNGKKKPDGTEAMSLTSVRADKEANDDRILRIENALTGVQAELRRCVDSMRQLDEIENKVVAEIEGLTPLFDAIVESAGEGLSTDDIPEIEQAAAAGDDVVEPSTV